MTQPALFPAPRHRTGRERRAAASAQAAIARATARATNPAPAPAPDRSVLGSHQRPVRPHHGDELLDDELLGRLYPYVTPARATAIRAQIEEDHRA